MGSNTKQWNITIDDVCSRETALAARKICFKNQRSSRGKKFYRDNANLFALAESIRTGDIDHQGVRTFVHVDKYSHKSRTINVPSVRDKLIMHMLIVATQPYMTGFLELDEATGKSKKHDGYLIRHTIASIENRGIEYGRKCLRHWARVGGSSVKYVVKWDLKKYYDSVDIIAFIRWLKRRIKDKQVIRLWWVFLYRRQTGLVIGSPLSQWAANLIFGPVGHWIKEQTKASYHLQYMDDGVAFFSSLRNAKKFSKELETKCEKHGLTIKHSGSGALRIWKWSDAPIDMIGYKTYRSGFQELRPGIYLSINQTAR